MVQAFRPAVSGGPEGPHYTHGENAIRVHFATCSKGPHEHIAAAKERNNAMNLRDFQTTRRLTLTVLAAAVLVGGATWRGFAAGPPSTQAKTPTAAQPTVSRAGGGDRDSYADIVKVVAPAVVTVRVESKAESRPRNSSSMIAASSSVASSTPTIGATGRPERLKSLDRSDSEVLDPA